ncbi:MAG: biotin/lipoyl-binding protein [Micropruina sp.]|uniref:efflux RND transporter periplasmic adaptor subunit n=1 Tax=Micropruina sp. TaxID=2737536 RepID=UPI0039E5B826
MSGKKWLWLSVAVLVLAAAGVGGFLLLRPAANREPQAFSRTVQATQGTQTQTVSLDGTLSPRKQSDVNFAVSGTITDVYVKAGQKVKKNQKLARIDDTDLADAVDVAEANLTTAQANYDEVVDNDGSTAAINSAKAQVASAKASLTSAKQDLNAAVLRSPIAGTVAAVTAEEGDSVSGSGTSSASSSRSNTSGNANSSSNANSSTSSASSAQFSVISTATWKLEGSVGSADLGSLKAGQSVAVTPSGASKAIKGTVASVGIVATSTSDGAATFPIVVNLSGNHTDLYSGTTASAVITTGSYPDVLTVPTAAIRTENGKTVVTKVDGSATSTVEVSVGRVFGSDTEITKGLSDGDSVQITFVRPNATSSTGSQQQGQGPGGFGGGFGGGLGGGQPPGGGGNGNGNGRQGR